MDEQQFRELAGILYAEIRSPLTSIGATADLLLRSDLGALTVDQTDVVQGIQHNSRRCFRVIHDIYQIMRLRTGEQGLVVEALDLTAHLDQAIGLGAHAWHDPQPALTV